MTNPCKYYLKSVCANVIKSFHLKRNTYLQIMSIGFFRYGVESICKSDNEKLNFFADPILIKIKLQPKTVSK